MKTAIFLTNRFIKAHKIRSILSVLIISLFIAAFEATFIYAECYQTHVKNKFARVYGLENGVIYTADTDTAKQYLGNDRDDYGAISCNYLIDLEDSTNHYYIGYMPRMAFDNKKTGMISGRLPEKADEAAVERTAYVTLGITAKVGETFSVPVKENGKTVNKTYTLSGITEDYLLRWQSSDASKKSFYSPPPVVVTAYDPDASIEYINVMCNVAPPLDWMGGEFSEQSVKFDSPQISNSKNSVFYFTIPLAAYFAFVMVFGIVSVLKYTMNDRDRYMELLMKIGMRRKQCRSIYLVMGVYLTVVSSVAGSLLGILAGYVATRVFVGLSGGTALAFVYDPISAFIASALCAVIIMLSFTFSSIKHYSSSKKKKISRRRVTEPFNTDVKPIKLIKRCISGKNIAQKIIIGLLTFSCITVSGFGWTLSQFLVRNKYTSYITGSAYTYGDVELYISGGTSGPEYYQINQPEGSGITQKNLDRLLSEEGVTLRSAMITETFGCYVVYDGKQKIEYFENMLSGKEYNTELTEKKTPTYEYALKAAEATKEDHLFQLTAFGVSDDMLKNMFPGSKVNKDAYDKGLEVVASSRWYKVGDKVRLLTVASADNTLPATDPGRFSFAYTEATVAYVSPEVYGIAISSEYLGKVHSTANYCTVRIDVDDNISEERIQRISDIADSIAASSQFVSITNYLFREREFIAMMANGILTSTIILVIFVLFVSGAVVTSSKLRIRTNMHSFMYLRAIGADDKIIYRLMSADGVIPCAVGGALAFAASTVLSFFLFGNFAYINMHFVIIESIVFSAVVLAAIITLSVIVSRRQVRQMLDLTVSEGVREQE